MGPKAPPSGHIKDGCWEGARTPSIPRRLGCLQHLPGLGRGGISPSAPQGQAGAVCSGLLRSGGRGGELRAILSFPPCQGCSPLPGPDQPWESGYLGFQGLSLHGLDKKPLNTPRYFAESAVSPPAPTPALFELGSAQRGYSGFLISPGPDKLLIKRALPPIPFTVVPPRSPEGGAQGCCCPLPPSPPWSAGLIYN